MLHYQPIVDTADSRIVGVEALLRWQHPGAGLLEPSAFIPVAERRAHHPPRPWALDAACAQGAAWQRAGIRRRGSPSICPGRQLRGMPDFPRADGGLAHHGLDAGRLVLELTEGLVMDGDRPSQLELHPSAAGGRRAFRAGRFRHRLFVHRSPHQAPAHRQPEDRPQLRHGLFDNPDDAGITTAILAMARHLGLDVVAEGVGPPPRRDFLHRPAAARWGYLFSPPLPAAQMEQLLRESPAEPG